MIEFEITVRCDHIGKDGTCWDDVVTTATYEDGEIVPEMPKGWGTREFVNMRHETHVEHYCPKHFTSNKKED